MNSTVAIDQNSGEEFLIRTGCNRIVTVEGVGPALGDGWVHYLVEFEVTETEGHEAAAGLPRRPVVAAHDPLLVIAIDAVTSAEPVDWVVEGRRLPQVLATTPYDDLDEVNEVSFHLVGLGGVAAIPAVR